MSGSNAITSSNLLDSALARSQGAGRRGGADFASLLKAATDDPRHSLVGHGAIAMPLNREADAGMALPALADRALPLDRPTKQGIALGSQPGEQAMPLNSRKVVSENEMRKTAKQLVASALLMPVLEQMDNSPFRPEKGPFALNMAEKRFGPILHQQMADRMMQSRSFGLVDAIVARLGGGKTGGGKIEISA